MESEINRRGESAWAITSNAWPVAAIVLLSIAAFAPALGAPFVDWDDNHNFTSNEAYRGLGLTQLKWMWTTTLMGHYIPLSWMTLGADYALWGMDARGYHATNIALHCLAAVLLYHVALRLFRAGAPATGENALRFPALASALVFSVHPLRVESVAWITERRDMLSLVFCLAAVLAYLEWTRGGSESRRWYVAALCAFVAGLLSKATIVTLPVVLLVLNVFPLRRLSRRDLWSPGARRVYLELAPFFALSIALGALSVIVLRPPAQLPPGDKIAVTAYSLWFYTKKVLVPSGLAALYEMPRPIRPWSPPFVTAYIFCGLALIVAWRLRRKSTATNAVLVASLAILFPLLGLVQNGPQIAADRYTYHAAAAFSLLAGLLLMRWPFRTVYAGAAALILSCVVLSWRQTQFWTSPEKLWLRILAVDSTSSVAHVAMGDRRVAGHRVEEALDHYERGVRYDPDYPEGHNNLGVLLVQQGRVAEALAHYERAVTLRPEYADAHLNWGVALSASGRPDSALGRFARALALDSRLPNAHLSMGNALLRLGRMTEAIEQYAAEVAQRPSAEAHLNWGVALAQQGRYAAAIAQFTEAARLKPDLESAREYRLQAERLLAAHGR